VTPEQLGQLQQQLYALQAENEQLRHQINHLAQQQQANAQRREQVIKGGGRLLIPLLDRAKVVRSFGKLAETAGNFTGPREQWPTRDDVLGDARLFLESLVRFAVRRRTLLLMLALLGAIIPAIQIWLVVRQNEIIENQNEIVLEQKELSEIQVYDIVSRSMTEGDRNAKLMTGALLSRADPAFLSGVVEEAFDPVLAGSYGSDSYNASTRRLEDAAFRGHLVRAAVRGIHRQAEGEPAEGESAKERAEATLPTLRRILQDSALRVPEVLRLGRNARGEQDRTGAALDEEVEGYLRRVGEAMQMVARLSRVAGHDTALAEDLRPLMRRIEWSGLEGNRFRRAHALALELLLLDLAVQPEPRAPLEVDLGGQSREEALARGMKVLRERLGADGIDWAGVAREAGIP